MIDDVIIKISAVPIGVGKYKVGGRCVFSRDLSRDDIGALATGIMQVLDGLMDRHDHNQPIGKGCSMEYDGLVSRGKKGA